MKEVKTRLNWRTPAQHSHSHNREQGFDIVFTQERWRHPGYLLI